MKGFGTLLDTWIVLTNTICNILTKIYYVRQSSLAIFLNESGIYNAWFNSLANLKRFSFFLCVYLQFMAEKQWAGGHKETECQSSTPWGAEKIEKSADSETWFVGYQVSSNTD